MATSPDVSQDVEEVEDEYEDQVQQEQFDFGDEDAEDIIDEDVDGEGDVEEDDKQAAQEALDLDMNEEDGIRYRDEPDGQDEVGGIGYQEPQVSQSEGEGQQQERALERTAAEICDGDDPAQLENANRGVAHKIEEALPKERSNLVEGKNQESKDDLLLRPEHGSEVFIGNISKDTSEEDLIELCASCGDIFEVRVMRDKDSSNKGFAFVTFANKEIAQKAIQTLHDCELKGRKLRFSPSQLKNKIFIGNVPKSWRKEELEKVLVEKGPGLQHVELLKDPHNPDRNRGFAFAEYYNNACADNAKRALSLPGFKLGINTPTINWAESPSGVDNLASSQVKVVYVRNLPENATQEEVWKLFEKHGEITKVMLPPSKPGQRKRDFGFVHFAERSSALKAIEKTEKYILGGQELETSLAKQAADKRPGGVAMNGPFGAGILPHQNQSRGAFGFSASDVHSPPASGFGSSRGYGQVQPVIYGRGPAPAGMTMVPMMLPDGRIGYVLQQAPRDGPQAPYRDSGKGSPRSQRHGGSSSSRRYRPY